MILHKIINGFINHGTDNSIVDFIQKSTHVEMRIQHVHNSHGQDYIREMPVRVSNDDDNNHNRQHAAQDDNEHRNSSSSSNTTQSQNSNSAQQDDFGIPAGNMRNPYHKDDPKRTIPKDMPSSRYKEIYPGIMLGELAGKHKNDKFLREGRTKLPNGRFLQEGDPRRLHFPNFHKIVTKQLLHFKTSDGKEIRTFDYEHLARRMLERTVAFTGRLDTEPEFVNTLPHNRYDKLEHLRDKTRRFELMKTSDEEKSAVVEKIKNVLSNPTMVIHKYPPSVLSKDGHTLYVTNEMTVAVVNLPNNKCVLKTIYPTSSKYRRVLETGFTGSSGYDEMEEKILAIDKANEEKVINEKKQTENQNNSQQNNSANSGNNQQRQGNPNNSQRNNNRNNAQQNNQQRNTSGNNQSRQSNSQNSQQSNNSQRYNNRNNQNYRNTAQQSSTQRNNPSNNSQRQQSRQNNSQNNNTRQQSNNSQSVNAQSRPNTQHRQNNTNQQSTSSNNSHRRRSRRPYGGSTNINNRP